MGTPSEQHSRVYNADHTRAGGRHGGAGAEDAAVRVGGVWVARGCGFSGVVAGRRGLRGGSVFHSEAAGLGAPLLQGEHCRERRRRCGDSREMRNKSAGV